MYWKKLLVSFDFKNPIKTTKFTGLGANRPSVNGTLKLIRTSFINGWYRITYELLNGT